MVRKSLRTAWRAGGLLLLGLSVLALGPTAALCQAPSDFAGTETCLDCHDDLAAAHQRNVHGRLQGYQYPGLATGCESCHGPGARHAGSEDPADIFLPTADMGLDGVGYCLDCHKTGHTVDWETSAHAEADVSCLSCHDLHGAEARPALLAGTEEDVCFACHLDTKGKFQLPSRHPVKDGFMACSSCHDVHGGRFQDVAAAESPREACLACHPQHAGPFIFEHSPVEEDCNICHDVHGTVANNLLRQNEPFLCLQCHQPHFHTILAGAEGDYSAPGPVVDGDADYAGMTGTSHVDAMKSVMMTKCTQCHQSIHGSDLPSQSITGQGRALNR